MADDPVVELLKEWLVRVEKKIDDAVTELRAKVDVKADRAELAELRAALAAKADNADLATVVQRVDQHDTAISKHDRHIERQTINSTEKKAWQQFVVPLVISLALLAVAVIQVVK